MSYMVFNGKFHLNYFSIYDGDDLNDYHKYEHQSFNIKRDILFVIVL